MKIRKLGFLIPLKLDTSPIQKVLKILKLVPGKAHVLAKNEH
jgi:hypothetical protein